MTTIESLVSELTNEELKTAFDEITEWRKEGVLPQGVLRRIHKAFAEANNQPHFPIHAVDVHFLYEMSKRAYNLL